MPADVMEAEHVRQVLARVVAAEDPFSRSSLTVGHVTASALVLSPKRDAVLLIHHKTLARWLQPGGHVEPDDVDIDAASRREVGEECGLSDLAPLEGRGLDVDVHVIPANPKRGEGAHRHFDVRRWWVSRTHELAADLSEVHGAAWVPLTEVAARSDGSVVQAVQRLGRATTVPLGLSEDAVADLLSRAEALDAAGR